MMSPLSVAQFLEPGAVEFDLLVIDEASQIQPVDAFGAIARCKTNRRRGGQANNFPQLASLAGLLPMAILRTKMNLRHLRLRVSKTLKHSGLCRARGLPEKNVALALSK